MKITITVVLIIFPVILQTVTNFRMLSIREQGERDSNNKDKNTTIKQIIDIIKNQT